MENTWWYCSLWIPRHPPVSRCFLLDTSDLWSWLISHGYLLEMTLSCRAPFQIDNKSYDLAEFSYQTLYHRYRKPCPLNSGKIRRCADQPDSIYAKNLHSSDWVRAGILLCHMDLHTPDCVVRVFSCFVVYFTSHKSFKESMRRDQMNKTERYLLPYCLQNGR